MESVRADIQTKIQNLNPANVSTGVLYDRTVPLANLPAYGNKIGLINPMRQIAASTSPSHFFLALEDLWHTDYLNRFPDPEVTYNNNQVKQDTINIGVINTDLNLFREDAVDIGALLVQGADSLFYENPNTSISPYQLYRNAFLATPLKKKSLTKTVAYHIDSQFWIETAQSAINKLEIDFKDGNGFITVYKNNTYTIFYPTYGTKQITLKATFKNQKTKTVNSDLELVQYSIGGESEMMEMPYDSGCNMPISLAFSSSPYTFQGYEENQAYAGNGKYINHSGNTCVDKPIIVVEGYDPDDSFTNLDGYGQLNVSGLGTRLRNNQYDVFSLNFEPRIISGKEVAGGSDYIERNAMVLVKMITYLNQQKSSLAEPTKIIGFSMGGLIARYALRYMELNNLAHDVDLYVSVDAPHQGATIPRGAQEIVDFIDDSVPEFLSEDFSNIGENLENPAVRQLLSNHYRSSTFHNTFYTDLNNMGYPQNSRNIAVVNGSFNGNGTNDINQKYFEGKGHLLWVVVDGKIRLNFTRNSGNARVFYWRLKMMGITMSKRERYAYTDPAVGSLENAPGGIASIEMLDKDILKLTDLGFDWFVIGASTHLSTDEFSFIPTKSALDYQGDLNLYEDINSNLVCSLNTPFNSYFSASSTNEPHTFLSAPSSYYLFEEIQGNPQDPNPGGTGTYPSGGSYKVQPPNGGEYPLQTEWGDNFLPGEFDPYNLPIPQKTFVWPDIPHGASNPYWELYSDSDNALYSWNSNSSTMTFHFMPNKFDADIVFQFNITDECGNPRFTRVKFTIVSSGDRAQQIDNFVLYPVPADDMLSIISTNTTSSNSGDYAVLYDIFGQELRRTLFNKTNSLVMDVNSLPEGLYLIKIITQNGEIVNKHINIKK